MSRLKTRINIANPGDHDWTHHTYLFAFGSGQCGALYVLVYANGCDSALEEAAEWLAEYAPGFLLREGSEGHRELVREVCEERGVALPDGWSEEYADIFEKAEADLTRTEVGFLTSYEWTIVGEDMTKEELIEFHNCATHKG